MKVIGLLNKIANDKNYRPMVKYKEIIYKYEKIYGDYVKDTSPKFGLFSDYCINMILNDEVEIIEEPQEHKIPEKLTGTTLYGVPILNKKELSNITLTNKRDIVDIKDKINEILDYLGEIE